MRPVVQIIESASPAVSAIHNPIGDDVTRGESPKVADERNRRNTACLAKNFFSFAFPAPDVLTLFFCLHQTISKLNK